MSIEEIEAQGQQDFVRSTKLPSDMKDPQDLFEAMGIKFGPIDEKDEIFRDATLPEGWTRKPTDHNMWSEIVDDRDIVRAMVFYKAAPYDRNAFMDLVTNVGARVLDRALNEPEYDVPWELLTPQEGSQVIARMIEVEGQEVSYDKSRWERDQQRIKALWGEAENRAADKMHQWRDALSEQ